MDEQLIKITGGTIYDPLNGTDGTVADIYVARGKIVDAESVAGRSIDRTVDASGRFIMPGGIDMHCHISGPKVNLARIMQAADDYDVPVAKRGIMRAGNASSVATSFVTAYQYAALGYTTAFDAAISPVAARGVHEEFRDTPMIDKGFYALVANNRLLLDLISRNEIGQVRDALSWLLDAVKGFAPKLVNPGGVEEFKRGRPGVIDSIDDSVLNPDLTPRKIINSIATVANELGLPHPVHIHANNLGIPGNWRTTLDTMKAVDGLRAHLTHIQFHSYGGNGDDESQLQSQVEALADYVNTHENISVDVGQVLFGSTVSMTGDSPLGYYLQQLFGKKWASVDCELESGCGISPITYRDRNRVHAMQWAIGLEWFLRVNDPWRIVLTTDHPNGGSFRAYPQIIRLLMDSQFRNASIDRLPQSVRDKTALRDLDREYSLSEIATITRAGPARLLGLTDKGHLGAGADADLTIYTPAQDWESCFQLPYMVMKSGVVVVEDCEIRAAPMGKTLFATPVFDSQIESKIGSWYEQFGSIRMANVRINRDDYQELMPVACTK